jgi:hypothetical protein
MARCMASARPSVGSPSEADLIPFFRRSPFCRARGSHFAVLLGKHPCWSDVGDRRLQLVLPAAHDISCSLYHGFKPILATSAGSSFFAWPTLVSSMSARSKKSVSVAPGIGQVMVTPLSCLRRRQVSFDRVDLASLTDHDNLPIRG